MNLTQNLTSRNTHRRRSKISHFPKNRYDLAEIIVLTELIGLKRRFAGQNTDFCLRNCFAYFWERFRITRLQMRKLSHSLHSSGIVKRSFREKELDLTLGIDDINIFIAREVK